MILKKSLKRGQAPLEIPERQKSKKRFLTGQAIFEYFLIFAAVLMLGLLSASTFFPKVRDTVQGSQSGAGYAQKAFDAIINADLRW